MLNVLENCRVSPPPATVGDRSLPLTFFDAIWILFFPISQIFFYEFPHSKSHFLETIVPNLKHSLSITLQHFFPFAGNLIVYPNPNHSTDFKKPEIRYVEGDSVAVSFAESSLDFDDLIGNHPRSCDMFYPLVPALGRAKKISNYVAVPLFSVQVTCFPNKGISIGLTNHHTLCDASSRFNFLKVWTSIAKHGIEFLASESLPLYDRVIKYPNTLDEIYMNQPGMVVIDEGYQPAQLVGPTDKVRATFVLTQAHTNRLKNFLKTKVPTLEYVSSFVVSCAFIWSCTAKSRARVGEHEDEDDVERFICAVDWKSRFDPPIPQTYFGNCVGACISPTIKSRLLVDENGFLVAAEVLGKALSETLKSKDRMFKEAETLMEKAFEPVRAIGVSGTPKIRVYDVDFGWGKPKKHETPSIDYNGSISVNSCRDSPGDIEIGLCLPAKQMDAYISIHKEELQGTFYDKE
ncbi:malonyl-coenzyme A:anthocyanin 3-O-glucoside-6''-O-malonyltransferase-like [Rutidosis leptorrhynchoides]|uniref:malonyl-coenzyme A:anthocyanin 3-O-glucoside-6''-O-malonyltransferase-like n=1 Tax=Rutidosis leptorrhynchoides TaxID=125765 RepID=UPI003A9A3A5B